MYLLENSELRVCVKELGAELHSIFVKKENREILWTGKPEIWDGQSPLLFPVVGRLKDDKFTYGGKEYSMPMHGFAKSSVFTAVESSAEKLVMVLEDSKETAKIYPFRFLLRVTYALEGAKLSVKLEVLNKTDGEMYFSIGAHPGFLCGAGDSLVFDEVETLETYRLSEEEHLLKAPTEMFLKGENTAVLAEEMFATDAVLLKEPRSTGFTLVKKDGGKVRVELSKKIFWLGLWTMAGKKMEYVCIEPWFGADDAPDVSGKLEEKPAICKLSKGESFSFGYTVTAEA